MNKLDWINQHYLINNVHEDHLWERIKGWAFSDEKMKRLMPLVSSRMRVFSDFIELCDFFFISHMPYNEELFKASKMTPEEICGVMQLIIWTLEAKEDWSAKAINEASREVATKLGLNHKKNVMPALFAAIQGKLQSTPTFSIHSRSLGKTGQESVF